MQYSKTGLALTESFEGCKLAAYQDSKGVWTLGFGHTAGVRAGQVCDQEQADAWLLEDVQTAVNDVNRLVSVPLTQNEFDSICDFVYNVGGGNFASSTMLKLLNAGNYSAAAEQFDRWDQAGGVVIAGLLRRREAEQSEFNGQ